MNDFFFFQAEDGIRDAQESRGLGDVYKRQILEEACHSLKLECALRDLGFVDIGWKCVAHAGIFFIQPVGLPDDPDGELLGFSLTLPNTHDMRRVRLMRTAKRALDYATGVES